MIVLSHLKYKNELYYHINKKDKGKKRNTLIRGKIRIKKAKKKKLNISNENK